MDKAAWIDPYNRIIPINASSDESFHVLEVLERPKRLGISKAESEYIKNTFDMTDTEGIAMYMAKKGWVRFRASEGLTYLSGQLDNDRATLLADKLIKLWPALAKSSQNVYVTTLKGNNWRDLSGTSRNMPTLQQVANGSLFKNESLKRVLSKLERLFEMDEKESWFEERTYRHIDLVKKAAKMIADKYPEFEDLINKAADHDASKFEEPERTPYISISWRHKLEDKEFDPINGKGYQNPGKLEKKEENDATLHHIKSNSHHPEFWNKEEANLSAECRDKSDHCIDASKMEPLAIAEMVADWQAMSWELKKNTAREWYDKQKNVRWKFSDEQNKLIDKLLKVFEE